MERRRRRVTLALTHIASRRMLALYLDPYPGGSPGVLESLLMPKVTGDDVSRVTLSDHHLAYIHSRYIISTGRRRCTTYYAVPSFTSFSLVQTWTRTLL